MVQSGRSSRRKCNTFRMVEDVLGCLVTWVPDPKKKKKKEDLAELKMNISVRHVVPVLPFLFVL